MAESILPDNPKVFISQPMTGMSDAEIRVTRNAIINAVKDKWPNAIILDHEEPETIPINTVHEPLVNLATDFMTLSKADVIVFDSDWRLSNGCHIERACAALYHISAFEISYGLNTRLFEVTEKGPVLILDHD